jgi:hypothetical protein
MKRREFLALVSAASAGVVAGGALSLADEALRRALLEAHLTIAPRRQGFGYPVRVTLQADAASLIEPPRLMAVREAASLWVQPLDPIELSVERIVGGFRYTWTPPKVVPSREEMATELVRYRLVVTDDSGRPTECISNRLEVVCGLRGWGC